MRFIAFGVGFLCIQVLAIFGFLAFSISEYQLAYYLIMSFSAVGVGIMFWLGVEHES